MTGTRAEFGLMRPVLEAIRAHPGLELQIIATGMHLDKTRGETVKLIKSEGWRVDAVAAWKRGVSPAEATGSAMARIAAALDKTGTHILLVAGDRVEAFAGAAAGAIGGRVVAHVHGGDRALGQVDDSLRHAITKLAHIHFPATEQNARRIARLGEEKWRIHCVGSPGLDGIVQAAASSAAVREICDEPYALVVLHPVDADEALERKRAETVLSATLRAGIGRAVIIHPNNDPGAEGIARAWKTASRDARCIVKTNVGRELFLVLLRDAAVLVGNSSSGIIEAASFGTPVVDIGPRQMGRQRCADVRHVEYEGSQILQTLKRIWNNGNPRRGTAKNPYSRDGMAGLKIADILGRVDLDARMRRKLIAY